MPDFPSPVASGTARYSVIVPFFDEADNVEPLLQEIMRALAGRAYEIIAVDDCSRDDTGVRLQALCGQMPQLRLVTHPVNRGQSAALCSGADAACGEWLVTLDGDGQNDPRDIPALLELLKEDAVDMICGHRIQRRDNLVRRWSSWIANAVRSALLTDATPDTGCGLKVVRRTTFQRLPRFDHMHRFLPALALRENARVCSVPVSHRPRWHGRSKYGVWNRLGVGLVDLLGVMWLQRRAFRRNAARNDYDDN